MPIYRLAEGMNPDGLPFLLCGHSYLADGTPLTEPGRDGRVVPAQATLAVIKVTCSGGLTGLAERRTGIAALARALDNNDAVRAPLLLLFLQIDPDTEIAKYNPFHKPPGPGGGQFASGPQAGSSSSLPAGFQHVGQLIDVQVASTYKEGIPGNEKIDAAHRTLTRAVYAAILLVDREGFRPGMPDYGQQLHMALAAIIRALDDPDYHAEQVYLFRVHVLGNVRLPGSSVPDVVFGPVEHPLAVFELKTGSAADTSDPAVARQRERTLSNMPGEPAYEHFLVR